MKEFIGRLKQNFGQNLGHNLELYATILVCGFLLILKILRIETQGWMEAAILTVLLILAVSAVRDRSFDSRLLQRINQLADQVEEPGVRWFARRSDATTLMLHDLQSYSRVSFLGISHQSLHQYLQNHLQAGHTVPWETIDVCFASATLGAAYEGRAFDANMRNARQNVAALLTRPAYRSQLPKFAGVHFFQHNAIVGHTGSIFGNSSPAVVYVVHSSVRVLGDLHQDLTMRLATLPDDSELHRMRIDHYIGTFNRLKRTAHNLGSFVSTVWDRSAEQWTSYAEASEVLPATMKKLLDVSGLRDDDLILDVGAGSGITYSSLIRDKPQVRVTLLDSSPQMIQIARDYFRDKSNIQTALCQVPGRDCEELDIPSQHYSLIIIHQSLKDLVSSFGGLDQLAAWCKTKLCRGGRVAIAAHNGMLSMPRPLGFEGWKDQFRGGLLRVLRKKRKGALRTEGARLTEPEITQAFSRQSFTPAEPVHEVYPFSYRERREMWRVPAVLDSIVDIEEIGEQDLTAIVDEVIEPLMGKASMPRSMTFQCFTLSGSRPAIEVEPDSQSCSQPGPAEPAAPQSPTALL